MPWLVAAIAFTKTLFIKVPLAPAVITVGTLPEPFNDELAVVIVTTPVFAVYCVSCAMFNLKV
jgi:hypothetical protein